MPGGNRMGPEGRGPMTGRGLGLCAGNAAPGYAVYGRGYGRGMGFGRGAGWGRGMAYGGGFGRFRAYEQPIESSQAMPPEVERWNLERDAEYLREELSRAEARLKELNSGSEPKGE